LSYVNKAMLNRWRLEERNTRLNERTEELEAALQKARPYVKAFADNCPSDDGGAEAVADLAAIDAALQAR